jgi:hypothetical protein
MMVAESFHQTSIAAVDIDANSLHVSREQARSEQILGLAHMPRDKPNSKEKAMWIGKGKAFTSRVRWSPSASRVLMISGSMVYGIGRLPSSGPPEAGAHAARCEI